MKAIALFARTTIVGGVFFLAPIVVLIVILAKAFGFAKMGLQAIVVHIPGVSDLSVGVATSLSIAMIALVCLLAGLVANTLIAQRFVNALESSVLSKIPAYEYLKQESASALGVAEIGELPVVFVPMEGGWQLGVQTEALSNGFVSIFVPGAPNPHSGSVFFFSTDVVRPAGIKLAAGLPQAMRRGRIRSRRRLAIRRRAGIKLRHRYGRNGMKIGIVGAGQVGATAAYSMMMRRVGSEIVLVDRNADLAVAQARDILDATPFADPVRVRAGEWADLDGARLVVLAAGTNQKPGESRLDLLSRNAEIFAGIVPAVLAASPAAIFLVATNPVDVMTQIVTAIAGRGGVASERVIGSGTILDSARFRTLLAAHLGISPTYIDARVLGEHGDSEVLHWSGAAAGNLPVVEVARQMGRRLAETDRSRIDTAVRRAADAIIKGKGATWFGVGAGLSRIAQAIEDDERALLTCSMLTPECQGVRDVALSLPRVLGAVGVVKTLMPDLDSGERAALKRSAEILKEAAEGVRF
jgi:L-lactate dehydrogenase